MCASPNANKKTRIAVLASGNGSNLQAFLDACGSGDIQGEIDVVVSTKRHAYALTRARKAKVETLVFDPDKFSSRTELYSKLAHALQERQVTLILLAGHMLKVEPCLLRAFPQAILNIHPALLPKYGGQGMYGRRVHEAVLAAQEKESGCTVHLIDELYDHGPILAQAKVPVDPTDTPESLAEKIHPLEHQLYIDVVRKICNGELKLIESPKGRI